jgi:glutathione S-transferase
MDSSIDFMGAPGSPYTRKMLGVLRYRHIAHRVHWTNGQVPDGFPKPKVALLPTFFLPNADGALEAVTDSTPLIRRFEAEYSGRSVIPSNPVLAFLNDLIEDYADEWLTKAMFHYRWAHVADVANAGPLLVHWADTTLDDTQAEAISSHFSNRQVDRLYVVGSNATTAPIIESAYARFLTILDELIARRGFVLGARPSSADFGIFGQLTQLGIVDPTAAELTRASSARVRAWIDRMDDLSGLAPRIDDWCDGETATHALRPLLGEIGRTYVPVMTANAVAVMRGEDTFETQVDGATWTQPTFRYQSKSLSWVRDAYVALEAENRDEIDTILKGTGCEALFL